MMMATTTLTFAYNVIDCVTQTTAIRCQIILSTLISEHCNISFFFQKPTTNRGESLKIIWGDSFVEKKSKKFALFFHLENSNIFDTHFEF